MDFLRASHTVQQVRGEASQTQRDDLLACSRQPNRVRGVSIHRVRRLLLKSINWILMAQTAPVFAPDRILEERLTKMRTPLLVRAIWFRQGLHTAYQA
jgi:hypothetical protein